MVQMRLCREEVLLGPPGHLLLLLIDGLRDFISDFIAWRRPSSAGRGRQIVFVEGAFRRCQRDAKGRENW